MRRVDSSFMYTSYSGELEVKDITKFQIVLYHF